MGTQLSIAVVAACPFPYSRGTPVRIQRLAEGLVALGHQVHVLTYPIGNDTLSSNLHIVRIPNPLGYQKYDSGPSLQKPFLDALLARYLANFTMKTHVDVIYAHHFEGVLSSLMTGKRQGIPIVYDAHTTLADELGTYHDFLKTKLISSFGRCIDSFVPFKSDHIISITDDIAAFLMKLGMPANRISVIPNGVEIAMFAQGSAVRARERFGLAAKPTIIYAGNVAPFQGVEHLLAAMPRVLGECPDAQFIFAVSGDAASYQSKIDAMGIGYAARFILEPAFSDVIDLLALADVAVVPRVVCPGIPLKMLNYMASAKAIVAFEGSAKMLKQLDTGYIVTNSDVPAFAAGIVACLSDAELRKRLGARAQQEVTQYYSWERMAANVSEVLERVVEAHNIHATSGESQEEDAENQRTYAIMQATGTNAVFAAEGSSEASSG